MTPVRLKVTYKTPESLLGELTKSVGRGGVRIEAKKALPVGTTFVFELRSVGVSEPVEVVGTVLTVTETAPGRFVLHIRYQAPRERSGIDSVLKRIFESSAFDTKRKAPRIPLHVRATENKSQTPSFRLRDISAGGVGIDVESDVLPRHIKVGTGFGIQMKLTSGLLALTGEVVWAVSTRSSDAIPPGAGIAFRDLHPGAGLMLQELLTLKALPTPPWIARVAFGTDVKASF